MPAGAPIEIVTCHAEGEVGDVIVAVDGEPTPDAVSLYRILDRHDVGDAVRLTVQRNGQQLEAQVELTPIVE